MPRTVDQINEKYERLADLFESDDCSQGTERPAASLRALMAGFAKRAEAENEIAAAVKVARADGHSWPLIGSMIGTSGQAARERYGIPTQR